MYTFAEKNEKLAFSFETPYSRCFYESQSFSHFSYNFKYRQFHCSYAVTNFNEFRLYQTGSTLDYVANIILRFSTNNCKGMF